MLRFFRTIRQRLLAQNRLGKYLLYALGAIVLVVIGENAVKIFYAHDDVYANGWAHASLKDGWASEGIDPELREKFALDENETLSKAMQQRLINESLLLISHNQRQIMLYPSMKEEISRLRSILESKCDHP
ncbi:hypothetical protein OZ410_06355 [Robiginitalea sp. M366]|uniref:hypothetical protein n=1 Tax=Robiginitalea aestuariiviva TaxID=3036903 RepID=UPI00240E0379|nr:hypothetical protein [Robiginitalea aestuariiviva]MDG1571931.1 hypothetical protein [Robiginitalea aestuariiviva]